MSKIYLILFFLLLCPHDLNFCFPKLDSAIQSLQANDSNNLAENKEEKPKTQLIETVADWVNERLKGLSSKEQEDLSFFFRNAVKKDHLGHVLFFSNKPGCLAGEFLNKKTEKSERFFAGWKVWKSKEYLFPHPNFLIYDFEDEIRKTLHIYIINKKTLETCLTLHEASLKAKLANTFSKEGFLKDLEEKQIGAFKDSEALTGFLLGFGIESSFAFHKKEQQPILCIKKEHIEFMDSHLIKLKGIQIEPLTFMGDPNSPEVQSLQKKYTIELEQIEALFQEEDFLQQVLLALCKP